jgi:hypothetical protein
MTFRKVLGVLLIAAGVVLVIFFRDARYEWFEGGWLGVALLILGVWDLVGDARRRRGHRPPTLLDDIKKDFGGDFTKDFGRSDRPDRDER